MKKEYLFFVEETSSTNFELSRIVASNRLVIKELHDFFCLYTHFQTSGRGMQNNRWESAKGENILASFYFKPTILPHELPYFNLFFAIVAQQLVKKYVDEKPVTIKFPNDIYVENRKIAGILVEPVIIGNQVDSVIAGVGINVNQSQFSASLPNPTSLYLETGQQYDIQNIMQKLTTLVKHFYPQVQHKDFAMLHAQYHHTLYQLGEYHFYCIENQEVEAKIIEVTSFGELHLVEKGSEKSYFCQSKRIQFLRK